MRVFVYSSPPVEVATQITVCASLPTGILGCRAPSINSTCLWLVDAVAEGNPEVLRSLTLSSKVLALITRHHCNPGAHSSRSTGIGNTRYSHGSHTMYRAPITSNLEGGSPPRWRRSARGLLASPSTASSLPFPPLFWSATSLAGVLRNFRRTLAKPLEALHRRCQRAPHTQSHQLDFVLERSAFDGFGNLRLDHCLEATRAAIAPSELETTVMQ